MTNLELCLVVWPRERSVEQLRRRWVDQFVPSDVVLRRDPRVRVAEQLGGELQAGVVMDCRRDGSAEHVRRDAGDAGAFEHLPEAAAHIRCAERAPVPGLEQQRIRLEVAGHRQPAADRLRCEGWERSDSP